MSLGPLPKVPTRRTAYHEAENKIYTTILDMEEEHNLTIAEVTSILSKAIQRYISPVVADEWRNR